jgi:integrase/recombinase XerD
MELYKQKGSKYWTADFFVNGRRVRKSTKQTTRSKAQEVGMRMKDQAQRREEPTRTTVVPTLREFMVKTFVPTIKSSTLSDKSKLYYQGGWKLLQAAVIEDETRLEDLRLDHITTTLADALEIPHSGSNQNMALRTLRRALSLALEKKLITVAPKVKLRYENQRTVVWDSATEALFLSKAKGLLRDVFILIQDTGMRPDEVLRLRKKDILWKKALIHIPKGKTKRSTRHVPLSDRVRDILTRRVSWNEYVFPARSKSGHKSHTAIEKPFRNLRRKLKLDPDLVLYSGRHTFATDMLDRTGNLKLVGDLLGHASLVTTARYLHPSLKGVAGLVNDRNMTRSAEVLAGQCHIPRHTEAVLQ